MEISAPENSYLNGVAGSSDSDVYAVGFIHPDSHTDQGLVYRYDGSSWTNMEFPFEGTMEAVWASSPANVYVSDLRTYHYNGRDWQVSGPRNNDLWGFTRPIEPEGQDESH